MMGRISKGDFLIKMIEHDDTILWPLKFDGTLVIIPDYISENWYDYNIWVYENCIGKVCSQNSGQHDRLFVFEVSEDAIAFKLRWL